MIRDMERKRRIPHGVINWAEPVRECHFVDNTACIRRLEDGCNLPSSLV